MNLVQRFTMYIQLVNKIYRYRYKLPSDINQYFPTSEITKTLNTDNVTIAKVKAMKIHSIVNEIVYQVRISRDMSLLSDAKIRQITQQYLRDKLTRDYKARIDKASFVGFDIDTLPRYKNGNITERILQKMQKHMSMLKLSHIKDLAEELSNEEMHEENESHRSLMFELLRTNIILFTEIQSRNEGKYSAKYFDDKGLGEEEPRKIVTVKEAFKKYVKDREKEYYRSKKGKESIDKVLADGKQLEYKVSENMMSTLRFLERDWLYLIDAESDINTDADSVLEATDNIRDMPIRSGKIQNLSAEELWLLSDVETITQHTYVKHMIKVKGFYEWCYKKKYIDNDIADEFPTIGKDDVIRESLTDNEIKKLLSVLSVDMQSFVKLLIYTGLRRSELWRCTIHEEYFDLNESKTKNKSSKRKVPKHRELQGIEPAEIERLRTMHTMEHVAKIINKAIRTHIAPDNKKKVLHSLRHSFATKLYQNGVNENIANELLGHSKGKTMSYNRYADGSDISELSSVVNMIDYSLPSS